MRTPTACLIGLCLALAACGDEQGDKPKANAEGAAEPASLADRIAREMATSLEATLAARTPAQMLEAVRAAEEVEILALHPWHGEDMADSDDEEEKAMAKRPRFHGYPVLGRKTLAAPADRERIMTLLAEGIARSVEEVADCFSPRHGMRIRGAGHTIDLVICYECWQMNVYGLPGQKIGNANTSDVVEPRVSDFFRSHGLEISEE